MNDGPQNKAFTLVEMLIGMAIIGLIVSMVYGSYAATTRSLDVYNRRMTGADRAHLVLRLMGRQLRGAYAPRAAFPTGPSGPAGQNHEAAGPLPANGIPASPAVIFRGDPRDAGGEILCFLTTGGLSQGPDKPGGLSRVRYRYETQGGVLSLCSEPFVSSSDARRACPVWRPVLYGVTNIDLEFHDGLRWRPAWNGREAARLPRAVRIVLTVADEGGRTHRYETAVPLACRTSTQKQLHRTRAGQL
jgi:prepilin-type N-terminal cleavage/methylation domain-containing protein